MPTVTKSTVITSSTVPSNAMPLQIGVTPALWLDGADASTLLSDGAASFASASSQYLSIASNSTLQLGGGSTWYFSLWFNKSAGGTLGILGKSTGLSSTAEYSLQVGSFEAVTVYDTLSTVTTLTMTGVATSTGAWYHIAAWYDGTTLYLSRNNGTPVTAAISGTLRSGSTEFRLGARDINGTYFNGYIDSVVICKNPTTSFTTLNSYLYNSGNGRLSSDFKASSYYLNGNPSGAVSWWDLDERSGTRLDAIGSNNLTDNNSVGYAAGIVSPGVAKNDGDFITQWSDKSGNARHVTAPSAAARPIYKTNQQNGKSNILFDGVNDALNTAANIGISGAGARTLFTVAKEYNSSTNYPAIASWGGSSTNTAYYHQIYNGTVGVAIWTNATNTAITSGSYSIISSFLNASNQPVGYRNGNFIGTIPATANTTDTIFRVGWLDGGVPQYLSSNVSEVILYSSNLSTSQRQRIERYLAEKWMSPPTVTLVTSSSSQYLEWAAVDMAGSYKVYYRVNGTTNWTLALTTTSLYAVVTGLTVGTAYDFRVDAVWSV